MSNQEGVPRRPVLLVILDGFGANPSRINNAVAEAETPRFDHYFATHPHTLLQASGRAVGLPDGQMGNSEVGHLTLGSGSVIRQDLVRIDDAIDDGSFFHNKALCKAMDRAGKRHRPVHLIGLVSDGGVHSHVNHLIALINLAKRHEVKPHVHMITDGRDTAPRCALDHLPDVSSALSEAGGAIVSVSGRYYAMDRDNRWERTESAFRAIALGKGPRGASAREVIENSYAAGNTDEFIEPTMIGGDGIRPGDAVIFFNFRKDRPRQLVSALFRPDFEEFDRCGFQPVTVTCMTEYDEWYGLPFAFAREQPAISLGHYLCDMGLRQFHCAETEKAAHVTYFLNGGHGDPFPGEERVIVPSPKVATYDLQPEMSAKGVADEVIKALNSGQFPFIVVNFANGDMVGHTAVREAVIAAVETLDREVGRVLDAAVEQGYSVILTADHGNCDEMVDPTTGEPHTQHTVYPVPCLIIDETPWRLAIGGGLKNVAPTVLHLMGLRRPKAMKGKSLLLSPVRA